MYSCCLCRRRNKVSLSKTMKTGAIDVHERVLPTRLSELHEAKRMNMAKMKQIKKVQRTNEGLWQKQKALSPLTKFGDLTIGGRGMRAKRGAAGSSSELAKYKEAEREYRGKKRQFENDMVESRRIQAELDEKIRRETIPRDLPSLEEATPEFFLRSPRGGRSPRRRLSREEIHRRGTPELRGETSSESETETEESDIRETLPAFLSRRAHRGKLDLEYHDLTVESPRDKGFEAELMDWDNGVRSESDSSTAIPVTKREANLRLLLDRRDAPLIDLVDAPKLEIARGLPADVDGYLDRIRGIHRQRARSLGAIGDVRRVQPRAFSMPLPQAPVVVPPESFEALQKRAEAVARAALPRRRMVVALPDTHQPTFSNRGVLSQSFGSRMGIGRHIKLGYGNIRATRGSATITLSRKNPQDAAKISGFLRVNFQFGAKVGGRQYALVGLVPAVLSALPGTVSVST